MNDPHATLAADEYLGPLVEEHGPLTIEPAEDFFARFVTSILRQQVSMASAAATRERLFDAVAVTPAGIAAADDETLREAGLSAAKVRYVRDLARTFREEDWDRKTFAGMGDDEARAAMTDVTGVGPWTANMQLIFSLGREDVFPVGDLGLRKGLRAVVDEELTRSDMRTFAERWAPYRSYATLYLWRVEEPNDTVAEVEVGD